MMRNSIIMLLLLAGQAAMAQSVDEATKFLYYDKLNSAETALRQVIQQDANNSDASYWLFVTELQQGDTAVAEKALNEAKAGPLVEAGRVHMLLIKGNKAEAQSKSDELVKDTKAKNAEVLKALAKAQIDARQGEGNYDYALELLEKAAKRGKKDPGIFKLMGDAWRRKGDGGNAVSFYQQAIAADPSYA